MELYKTVFIELRPKLKSANVFVTLAEDSFSDKKVVLNENNFKVVLNGDESFSVSFTGFKGIPDTLALLNQTAKSICFRFFTSSNGIGFKSEILQNKTLPNKYENIELLKKDVEYVIECGNCKRSLVRDGVRFQRILPLPENTESNDWFCHGHGLDESLSDLMEPKQKDLFYTHCFFLINKDLVCNVGQKNDVLVCKFCFNWLGRVSGKKSRKFWFNTVNFTNQSVTVKTEGLSDVFRTLRSMLDTCLFGGLKTILHYKTCGGQNNYLLLWILEKQLEVVLNTLKENRKLDVAKTFFKFVSDDNDEVVRKWKTDNNIDVVDVSKSMMTDVLKHLYENHRVLSNEFATSNEFLVSYLFMYDDKI